MSEEDATLARYAFLPWLRRGIGTLIAEGDTLGVAPSGGMSTERAEMEVALTIESKPKDGSAADENEVQKTFKFLGPPDVLAISTKAIVRTEPKPGVNNYEANGLPYIEFYEEDFLWAYTPAGAVTEKLTPWLALIALKEDEFTLSSTTDGRTIVTLTDASLEDAFHQETQHWAWGHVHLNTELTATGIDDQISEVTSELEADPDTGVSRLLCPRKLIKETNYTVFLIPAYETGRLAGLGESYTGVYAQQLSWEKGLDYSTKTRGYEYPVYYSWSFATGANGDFESLARLLEAVVMDPELGKRDMFIADAGYGLEDTTPSTDVLGIEGALKPPSFVSDAWDTTASNAYREHLRKLLNLSVDQNDEDADSIAAHPFYTSSIGDDPIVTPEIYGRWHSLATRLQNDASNRPWVNTLNLDPRNRAAAGLGSSVIRKNQEAYMRRAWKQVEQVNEANKKLRKATLATLINNAMYAKHLQNEGEDKVMRLTGGMHKYLTTGSDTVYQTVNASLVPNASQSAALRKITRPGKKSNRLINQVASNIPGANLLQQNITLAFNNLVGDEPQIKAAPKKKAPLLAVTTADVTTEIDSAIADFQADDNLMGTQGLFEALLVETDFNNLHYTARKNAIKARLDANADLSTNARNMAKAVVDAIESSTPGTGSDSHKIRCSKAPISTAFEDLFGVGVTAKAYLTIVIDIDTGGAAGELSRAASLNDFLLYQTNYQTFNTYSLANIPSTTLSPIASLAVVKEDIVSRIQPKDAMLTRISSMITVLVNTGGVFSAQTISNLKPIMAHPKFEDPMFRNLKAISQEYILPNISLVPNNSITLMETNQAFIEAYMAGLNHEMSRELLWREYPTDQRGTYFRQFWDIADNMEENSELRLDIKKMHLWNSELGEHTPRELTNAGGTYLVLLVRGELLKKYPNTQVYAQKAEYPNSPATGTPRTLADSDVDGNVLLPVFMAELDPDIYLFGFDLDKDEAKGDSSDINKPGWFFVLRERPGQIRFGLDDYTPQEEGDVPSSDPATWNDMSWEHLVASTTDLDNYTIDVTTSISTSDTAVWGKNAADMAYILYQNPVLYARHAQEMLPD
jgi:hypothetical protein